MIEEYKANGKSNKYYKWEYLYDNPDMYLLYKDQTDVLDYLIQQFHHQDYIPEALSNNNSNDAENTQPTTADTTNVTTNETIANDTETPEPNKSGFLNINYLIILSFLFF